MSEGGGPSASKISNFISDADLQGFPAVRGASADEETSGRNSPLSAYSDSENSFDAEEEERALELSVKKEKQKYHGWYQDLSEWIGEKHEDKE